MGLWTFDNLHVSHGRQFDRQVSQKDNIVFMDELSPALHTVGTEVVMDVL
jgi:hypothetical protein